MKSKLFIAVCLLTMGIVNTLAQTPSTEGRDFWVTFLRAADDDPTELKLTISAKQACDVVIENEATGYNYSTSVDDNSSTEFVMDRSDCYSSQNEQKTYTALHVTSTKDISLFAGNYRDKSFDATNVLPTSALLDDYLIQTYPPSDHENKPQGSHFAIIAVEDNTTIDYVLTAKTDGNKTGAQSVTLNKGQVWYVWTGKKAGDEADLSGTIVKARDKKPIAVFQGCPHTNIPYTVRDRDHIISQAMPTAYWGTEFGITASRKHRRDIVAVMAINDGTEVYINDEDGSPRLVHTFDFSVDKKHYWTFEIGEELAYCADDEAPSYGQLPEPLVADSSCYITTSCPAGVHLFMVSNRYDNLTPKVKSDTLVSDPAMLWMSPIEQVIKEINFATYSTAQMQFHFMNILTSTANAANMTWNGQSIKQYFHPLRGNSDYSFARIEITEGTHNLKGKYGFLAHVYGYGRRESYGYICGSSTVQQSISINDEPLQLDSISETSNLCVNDELTMKLNIGNNNYQDVVWDFGDGVSEKIQGGKTASHQYDTPGWYELRVNAVYVNACTLQEHTDQLKVSFYVSAPDTIRREYFGCEGDVLTINGRQYTESLTEPDTARYDCDSVVIFNVTFGKTTYFEFDSLAYDSCFWHNKWYYESQDIEWKGKNAAHCDSIVTMHLSIMTCLQMEVSNPADKVCGDDDVFQLPYTLTKGVKEQISDIDLAIGSRVLPVSVYSDYLEVELSGLKPGNYNGTLTLTDNYCEREMQFPVEFSVLYPTSVFKQKWDNVLAVMNKDYNGGYEFTAFQWLKNGEPIEGATGSWYHTDGTLEAGAEYSVLLTDKQGNQLASCPITIEGEAATEEAPKRITAQPTIANSGESILLTADGKAEVTIYNTLGQKEASLHFTDNGELQAPLKTGIYVMQAVFEDGSRDAVQLIIK